MGYTSQINEYKTHESGGIWTHAKLFASRAHYHYSTRLIKGAALHLAELRSSCTHLFIARHFLDAQKLVHTWLVVVTSEPLLFYAALRERKCVGAGRRVHPAQSRIRFRIYVDSGRGELSDDHWLWLPALRIAKD